MQKITPFLWFNGQAEEAAKFYVSLFPDSRVICCVRNPAWILDSIERRVQNAGLSRSRMFPDDAAENVYTRVEFMLKKGILSGSTQALRQACQLSEMVDVDPDVALYFLPG